ncbi:hypothetical protein KUCAC02_032138, partial [Chaenocephalus aceratus]
VLQCPQSQSKRAFIKEKVAEPLELVGMDPEGKLTTHGLVEKLNGTIQRSLNKPVEGQPKRWDRLLQGTMFALRTKTQLTTKFSPYYLMFGREARYPSEVPEKYEITEEKVSSSVQMEEVFEGLKKQEAVFAEVKGNVAKSQDKIRKRKEVIRDIWAGRRKETLWAKYGPYKVYSENLLVLAPGKELEREIVNAYLSWVGAKAGVFIVDSYLMTSLWQGTHKGSLRKKSKDGSTQERAVRKVFLEKRHTSIDKLVELTQDHLSNLSRNIYNIKHQFERPAPDERPAPVRPATSQAGTPHLASPSSRSEHLEATQDFTHTTILLLLDLTETHQQVYHHSKPGFYNILQRQFSEEGYSFSSDNIRKKLNNLLTTYKRAKDRCTSTGEGNITWEYYGIMDNLFGRCGVGSAPPGTPVSTPLFPTASQPSTTLPCASEAQPGPSTTLPCASEAQPGPSMTLPTTQPRSIRSRVSHPSFYDLYEAHSERRTSALETLVRPEQERRRRLKERNRRRFEALNDKPNMP